jgi:hypothetical protein
VYQGFLPYGKSGRGVKLTIQTPSSAEMEDTFTPPYVFMAWYLIKYRHDFTVPYYHYTP